MKYQVLVLDLDGTLTNSKKEITAPTKQALLEIQEAGRTVVLASGRPINGVAPLAKELQMDTFGGYMLSFNGARITKCSTGEIIYNKTIPKEIIRPVWEYVKTFPGLDIISYDDTHIFSGICPNKYVEIESGINNMEIVPTDDFPSALDFPVNKLLICGDPKTLETMIEPLRKQSRLLLRRLPRNAHILSRARQVVSRNIAQLPVGTERQKPFLSKYARSTECTVKSYRGASARCLPSPRYRERRNS